MSEFQMTRSTTIAAPPEVILAELVDFRRWQGWSPWEDLDPDLNREFTGADSGVGAHYAWSGNRKAGQGSMEITSVTPSEVALDLNFLKPIKANNKIRFTLTPDGDATKVDWTMSGSNDTLASKLFAKVMPVDKLVGKDFDKGLAQLKALAEGAAAPAY
ncbi:MAG: SRPBCC family protein [Solirubrobacteraceae bacterium]|nr:SRPBCC family protein [Solirubrobacteraceae bacterium]